MKNFEDHQPTPVPNPPAPASVTNPIESDPNTTISSEFSPAVPDPVQKEDFEPVATEQAMPSPGTAGHSSSRVTQAPGALAAPSTPRAASSKNKKKKLPSSIPVSGPSSNSQTTSHGAAGENTGRWTAEEHRLFLQGLEQHGKGWKKIASLIKSRTVVQIRTHAQKYFQKLAKARQNGEEGDVPMEGRGGSVSAPPVSSSAAQTTKRRRQTSGTKRKAIQSVVSSAQRQAKKHAGGGKKAPAPAVAPALSHFVSGANNQNVVPSVTTAQGTISGPALEDSLFRFLTPAPVVNSETQVNEVARQAGAQPITVPNEGYSSSAIGGEVSPTGVSDFSLYPSWTDAKDTPSWYAKGSDVDALFDVADNLDWLTDTGDLNETYPPAQAAVAAVAIQESAPTIPDMDDKPTPSLTQHPSATHLSMGSLPRVDSDVVVPPLPSLFDGSEQEEPKRSTSLNQLAAVASSASIDQHLQVFDSPLEEHEFVSTLLEDNGESSNSLPVLS